MTSHDHLPHEHEPDYDDRTKRTTDPAKSRSTEIEPAQDRPVLRAVPVEPSPDPVGTGSEVEPVVLDGEVVPEDESRGDPRDHSKGEDQGDDLDDDADDDEDEGDRPAPVPVNPPEQRKRVDLSERARAEAKRAAILPAWLRSTDELRFVAAWLVGYAWHELRFHGLRIPFYLLRLAGHCPRGLARTLRTVARWLMDSEASPLRREAVDRKLFDEYVHLAKLRRDRMVYRTLLIAPLALIVGFLVSVALTAGAVATAAIVLAGVVVFGLIGAPADRPVFGRAVTTHKAPRLTDDLIVRALGGLGISQITQALSAKGQGISFPAPIVRDGPGWRAQVDLPYGVTADDIIEKRKELASGLRRPLSCVWPEPLEDEHEGRLVLWVGDRPLNRTEPPAWPLAKSGQVDLFEPFTFGTDQRQRPVRMLLMFAGILIGAMPRMGKTFAMRVILLACALDPRAELRLFELKGTGDLSPLEPVAHHYASGADDQTLEQAMASAREVYAELETRAARISKQPRDLVPENKVTPKVASNRSLGLHPIVIGVDECQELFSHPTFKDEADRIFTAIVKRGPALGIMPVLATQRPDAKSLPTGISANIGIRYCLKVMGQTENDMVLGTSRYKEGVRATTFSLKDKGIGYLIGGYDNPEAQIARGGKIDAEDAAKIVARARKLRERAGTLSGHAIGELPNTDVPTVSLLEDLIAVTGGEEEAVWSEIACARLAELRPDTYRGWTAKQLADALKPYGIATKQVWASDPTSGEGRNRRGVVRAHLLAAQTKQLDGGQGRASDD